MSLSKPVDVTTWAGTQNKGNSLTGSKGKFNPRIPTQSAERNAQEEIIWADYPKNLRKRLERKAQKITEDCLRENAQWT